MYTNYVRLPFGAEQAEYCGSLELLCGKLLPATALNKTMTAVGVNFNNKIVGRAAKQ